MRKFFLDRRDTLHFVGYTWNKIFITHVICFGITSGTRSLFVPLCHRKGPVHHSLPRVPPLRPHSSPMLLGLRGGYGVMQGVLWANVLTTLAAHLHRLHRHYCRCGQLLLCTRRYSFALLVVGSCRNQRQSYARSRKVGPSEPQKAMFAKWCGMYIVAVTESTWQ